MTSDKDREWPESARITILKVRNIVTRGFNYGNSALGVTLHELNELLEPLLLAPAREETAAGQSSVSASAGMGSVDTDSRNSLYPPLESVDDVKSIPSTDSAPSAASEQAGAGAADAAVPAAWMSESGNILTHKQYEEYKNDPKYKWVIEMNFTPAIPLYAASALSRLSAPNGWVAKPGAALRFPCEFIQLVKLCDELCTAVDNESDDIGGSRPSLEIVRDIGKVTEAAIAMLPSTPKAKP